MIKTKKRQIQIGALLTGLSVLLFFAENVQPVEAQPAYENERIEIFEQDFIEIQAKSKTGDIQEKKEKPHIDIDSLIYYDIPFSYPEQKEINAICKDYNLDYELVLAVIATESVYDPTKIGDSGKSYGLMQIQPRWWQGLMDEIGVTDLLDPMQNVQCGCAILQSLQNSYHCSTVEALTYYNAGKVCQAGEEYTKKVLENYIEIRSFH